MLQALKVYCSFNYTHLCVISCAFPEFKLKEKPLLFVHTFVCILEKQLLTSNKNIIHFCCCCCRTQAAAFASQILVSTIFNNKCFIDSQEKQDASREKRDV